MKISIAIWLFVCGLVGVNSLMNNDPPENNVPVSQQVEDFLNTEIENSAPLQPYNRVKRLEVNQKKINWPIPPSPRVPVRPAPRRERTRHVDDADRAAVDRILNRGQANNGRRAN